MVETTPLYNGKDGRPYGVLMEAVSVEGDANIVQIILDVSLYTSKRIINKRMKIMFFDELKKLLLPPDNIDVIAIKKNIELVEKHYKFKFPQDYIHFITTYGSGQINEFISIYSAINSAAYYEMIERECQYYRDFKEEFPEKYTYNVFPKQNGLFPLGRTDGGCLMWWHMASEPKNWTIVIYDENSWENEKYDMQLCEFIYKFFTRQIMCKGFPDSLLESDNPRFIPNEFNFKMYCG